MGNLQDVIVGIKTALVDSPLFLHDIIVQWSRHLMKLVVAGYPLLDDLQEREEDSGLDEDWKDVIISSFVFTGWLFCYR